jgi:hypothetical protein
LWKTKIQTVGFFGKLQTLEAGETIRDRQELGAHGVQVLQALPETKVAKVIGAKFEVQNFSYCLRNVLPVRPEDRATVFDLINYGTRISPKRSKHNT